jgi:hypothetical protein
MGCHSVPGEAGIALFDDGAYKVGETLKKRIAKALGLD